MKVATINAELHVSDGTVNYAQPIRIALLFDDGPLVRLRVAGDGEGLIVDRLPLEAPIEMEEHGRIDTFDFTDRLDETLRGTAIGAPLSIKSPNGKLVGLAITRDDRAPFCIWVDGDAFHWGPISALKNHDWLAELEPAVDGPLAI